MTKLSTKNVIHSQLPRFIADDYQTFTKFLEAYYEFLESYEDRSIESITDIDESLDKFYKQFKFELDTNLGSFPNVDERILLRNIKDLYLAKGSKASYELLFRILFNKDVEITLPSEIVLKPSDNRWLQDISIVGMVTDGNPLDVVGKEVSIIANNKKLSVFVQKVKFLDTDTYEFYIDKGYYGIIEVGDKIQFESFSATIIPSISKISVREAGFNFKAGQIFDVKNPSGKNGKIKINAVDTAGKIVSVSIINFGFGYDNDFIVSIYPSIPETTISFTSDGSNLSITDGTNNLVDQGFISTNDYHGQNYVDQTYVGRVRSSFYNESTTIDTTNVASLLIEVGAVSRYPGYFESNKGFLSDIIKIQDSLFYQNFSYVIKIDEQFKKYKDIVKTYLHPAGTKMFGEYLISNTLHTNTDIRSLSNFVNRKITDSISNVLDVITVIANYHKVFADTFSLADLQAITISMVKGATETVSSVDNMSKVTQFKRVVNDTVDIIDALGMSNTKEPIYDYTLSDDTFNKVTAYNRTFTDVINMIDAAGVYQQQTYADSVSTLDAGSLQKNAYNDDGYFGDDYYVSELTFIRDPQSYDEATIESIATYDLTQLVVTYGQELADEIFATYTGQIVKDGYVDALYFDDPYTTDITYFDSSNKYAGPPGVEAVSASDSTGLQLNINKTETTTPTEITSILKNGWAYFYSDDSYATGQVLVTNQYSIIPDNFIEAESDLDQVVN